MTDYSLMRSALFMPGSNSRALEKARTLDTDAVFIDLEDAVAPADKARAHETVQAAFQAGPYAGKKCYVRVNAPDTPWYRSDMVFVASLITDYGCLDGVILPKVADGRTLADAQQTLLERGAPCALWAMIETPQAVMALSEIIAAPVALEGLIAGTNDLALGLRLGSPLASERRMAMTYALSAIVLAARSQGICALDGVYNDLSDPRGFEEECALGLAMGFDGKTLIHPSQLAPANRIFSPSVREVASARALIQAYEEAGTGVALHEGKMIEALHVEAALRTVALYEIARKSE